jgi:hypothetical protein
MIINHLHSHQSKYGKELWGEHVNKPCLASEFPLVHQSHRLGTHQQQTVEYYLGHHHSTVSDKLPVKI